MYNYTLAIVHYTLSINVGNEYFKIESYEEIFLNASFG